MEIDEICVRGKEAIVKSANELIEERFPELIITPEEYDITVWRNTSQVLVKYRRLVRYVAKDSNFSYDISANILSGEVLPFDGLLFADNFFIPTKNQKDVINRIANLLSLPYQGMDNEISEDEDNYYVSITSKTAFSHYIINKKTWKPMEPLIGTYSQMPASPFFHELEFDSDPLVEIKE